MAIEDANIDHYRVLGLEPSATTAEIRSAYRELSKRHHPDRGGDPNLFATVTTSYGVLSDPEARGMYDVERRLAASRAADALRAANGDPSGAQAWAATVFGTETPARPQRPGSPATRPTSTRAATPYPTDHGPSGPATPDDHDPMRATQQRLHYAAHRTVSYVIAAVIGGLWWPVQYLLAKLNPSSLGHPVFLLQQFVERPGAVILVPALAGAAAFTERRFFPVHTVRTTTDQARRHATSAAVVLVLWLNIYLAQWPYAVATAVLVGLTTAGSLVKKK